jgi:hypothetical protein
MKTQQIISQKASSKTKKKSVLELAKELPKGKFKELTQLLEPHEFIKNHRQK